MVGLQYQMKDGEWSCGDLAYFAEERFTTARKNDGVAGPWSFVDEYWKALVGFYRARVGSQVHCWPV